MASVHKVRRVNWGVSSTSALIVPLRWQLANWTRSRCEQRVVKSESGEVVG